MSKRAHVLLRTATTAAAAVERLRRRGFDVEASESLRKLGRALDDQPPDIVVVDGPFADRSGIDVLEQLRRAGCTVPAILLCGSQTEARAAVGYGALRPYLAVTALDDAIVDGPGLDQLAGMGSEGVTEPPPQGSLSETRMQDLLLSILSRGWTGRLELASDSTEKTVYFDRGLPIYCFSKILSENFGQMLLGKGVISEIEYEWAKKLQLREGIRQGEALVKIGVLNNHDLFGHLNDQIHEKIVNAFGWHHGHYELVDDDSFLDKVTRFALNPITIIVQGLQRFMSASIALHLWGGLRHRWVVGACDVAEIANSVRESFEPELVDALREPQLVADLALTRGWDRVAGAAIFSTLVRAGFIALADSPDMLPVSYGIDLVVVDEATRTGVFRALSETREHQPSRPERTEDERRLSESLWKAYLRLSCADYFAVLGVERSAGPAEVAAARDELLDVYAKERFRPVLDSAQNARALDELQHKIELAAEVLGDDSRRAAYLESLPDPSEQPRRQVLGAEDEFQTGLSHLEAGRELEAYQAFARAATLHPGDPSYILYSGWARYVCAHDEAERAEGRRQMTKAVAANPLYDEGYVMLARVYLEEGNVDEAIEQARTAITFNPENDEAAELLSRLES